MRRVVIALVVLAWMAASAAAEEIKQIVVEDNTKTTADTVIFISQLEEGDEWNPSMVDLIKQRLVSSGLFKDVEVYWTPKDGGVVVHILAKDKHSWVIAPAFYNQPTNKGFGVGYGENNLGGKNQKLLLYGQIATGDSFFIGAWLVPAIGGTRFYSQLDTFLKSSRNIEYSAPQSYLIDGEGPNALRPVRESRIHYLNFGAEWDEDAPLDRLRAIQVARFPVGSRVDAQWKGNWYPAEVTKAEGDFHYVRYDGYGPEWDEWLHGTRVRARSK